MNTPSDTKNLQDACSILLDSLAVAYVRPVITDKGKSYAVCAADGTQLALFDSEEAAFFSAKQHDLEPMLIH